MYVKITKLYQNQDIHTYKFECDSRQGLLQLNSTTDIIELIKPMNGVDGLQNYFRARTAILRELNKGVVPTETCFASG